MENDLPLRDRLFEPLDAVLPECKHGRACPDVSDEQFLKLGVTRVLSDARSGRAFLQQLGSQIEDCPGHGTFFEALKSERRLGLLREVAGAVAGRLTAASNCPQS